MMQNSVTAVQETAQIAGQNAEQPAAAALPAGKPVGQPASTTANVFLRNDTIFGVCEAIGEDFGFHANFLRVPLAALVIFNPFVALGLYAALGVAVLAARLLFPARRQPAASPAQRAAEPRSADNQTDEELLAA
jgi:phage shock protein PspC (stress-responsive transcriptional regulator)